MTYAEAIAVTKCLAKQPVEVLTIALQRLQDEVRARGVRISVYERGKCEQILRELESRKQVTQ